MVISNSTATARRGSPELVAPPAARTRRARWRSPQMVVGALLVLVAVVVGVRVVAAANDTVPVLVAAADLSSGQPLTPDMVETRHVALDDADGLYYGGEVGNGYVVLRDVRAGELLPKSAVVPAADVVAGAEAVRYVTLAVPAAEAPAGLVSGDTVDVWVTPSSDGDGDSDAKRLAAGLTATNADSDGPLGLSGSHATVTLAVRAAAEDELDDLVSQLIAASRDGRVYLSRLPDDA